MTTDQNTDHKTRDNLAYGITAWCLCALSFILYKYADRVEILTLIIGLIGGTLLGAVIGTYFAGQIATKKQDAPIIQQTGDSPTATTTSDQQ